MRQTVGVRGLVADVPNLGAPGETKADNCVWADGAYKPLNALSTDGDAITARCQGAFAARDADGNTIIYAGDATKLYQRTGTTWTDKSGTTYTTQATQYWTFRQFNTLVIATNFADDPQKITIGDGGNFSDLDAGAPKARHVGIIGQFLFLGDTTDATNGHIPHRVRWSAIGDPEDFPTLGTSDAENKQSDAEELNPAYGKVQAIADGEQFGLVFQETAITRFTYVGGVSIFNVDTYERSRGLFGPFAFAQIGSEVIFLARNGFYKTDGANVVSIGQNRIDQLVIDEIDTSYPERVSAAVDYANKLVYFSYPGTDSTGGQPNKLVIYNYEENQWTTGSETLDLIFSGKSLGYTLDQLDDVSASVDDLPASLDSPIWTGGSPLVSGFSTDFKLGSLTGAAKTAVIDMAESQLTPEITYVDGFRPLLEGGTATVTMGTRNLQTASVSFGTAVSTNSQTGFANFRSSARYHKPRVTIAGGFTRFFGGEYEYRRAGLR